MLYEKTTEITLHNTRCYKQNAHDSISVQIR